MQDSTLPYQRGSVKRRPTARQYRKLLAVHCLLTGALLFVAIGNLWARRIINYGSTDVLVYDLTLLLAALGTFFVFLGIWGWRVWHFAETWGERLRAGVWPCISVLTVSVVWTLNSYEVPFHLAFAASRASFEQAALDIKASPGRGMLKQRIGTFPIDKVSIDGSATLFHVEGSDSIDTEAMLIWSPGPPPAASAYSCEALGNDWYCQHR